MPWVKDNIGYSDYQVRASHPNTSFPVTLTQDVLTDFGYTWEDPAPVEPQPAPIPTQVTMRQARLALLQAGHYDTVLAAMAGQPQAAQIEWEYALSVDRGAQLTTAMASILGLSDAQIDALFVAASAL